MTSEEGMDELLGLQIISLDNQNLIHSLSYYKCALRLYHIIIWRIPMSLKSQIYDALWQSLSGTPITLDSIQTTLQSLKPVFSLPVENLHHHTQKSLHLLHGKAVCLRMMIQDIFEPEYYSAAAVKPGKIDTRQDLNQKIIVNKYWVNVESHDEIDNDEIEHVILDRESYRATIPKGQTEWVTKINGGGDVQQVILKCDNKCGFKLGQIVYLMGIVDFEAVEKHELIEENCQLKDLGHYYPLGEVARVNVIGTLSQDDIEKYGLNYKTPLLKTQLDLASTKQRLLEVFQAFCTPRYSLFLLYSLLNTQRMSLYISGENLESLVKQLVPYFVRVSITLPVKQQFFPKKVDVIRDTPLQLSDEDTFVILDFTNLGEGKLQGEGIQNIQLLKKFVQESEIIYKWQIGESTVTKNTSGIIARASSIIQPTFNLKDQSVHVERIPQLSQLTDIEDFRAFIVQVRTKSDQVFLSSEQEKTLIQTDFVQQRQQTQGKLTPETFSRRLLLCRLEAASLGETHISYKTYQRIKQLTL